MRCRLQAHRTLRRTTDGVSALLSVAAMALPFGSFTKNADVARVQVECQVINHAVLEQCCAHLEFSSLGAIDYHQRLLADRHTSLLVDLGLHLPRVHS